jgi:L-rhamnonate dehydratase
MDMRTRIEPHWKIEKIEWALLESTRSRTAGSNARLGVHGNTARCPIMRVTIDGRTGFGCSLASHEQAESLLGMKIVDLLDANGLLGRPYRLLLEYPLLDWLGRHSGKPVYALAAETSPEQPLYVPCYDTSLYFDDLHLRDDRSAVQLMQEEAMQGKEKGHRHFKIKVGRSGRHMPLREGTERDIAIVNGISDIAGPEGKLMIDANNGYNLNLTKEVLMALSHTNLYWIEEAFHEDAELYADLKTWMKERNMNVLIADGEGEASPSLVSWAEKGHVDVLQYDIIHPGFFHWLELGKRLDSQGIRSAPHCYGNHFGVYASCHVAPAISGFQFVEWDDHRIEGIDTSAYRLNNGLVHVPDLPGFGIELDPAFFEKRVTETGWTLPLR